MAIIKSSSDHLTLNADGASKDIKFQANGVEKASISSAGAFTSTTIDATKLTGNLPAISGASLTGVGGLYASVAMICDQKAYNSTNGGGTFTSGAWRTRDLNTEISDADGIVSISSNQFTLQSGTYTIRWIAPAYNVTYHLSQLYGATTASSFGYGSAHRTGVSGGDTEQESNGMAIVTLSSAEAFEIRHQCATTRTWGFGAGQNSMDSGTVNRFTMVEILKHS